MSDATTTRYAPDLDKVPDLADLPEVSDAEIHAAIAADPDAAPIADADWFAKARLVEPPGKVPISIRVDRDVLDFFKGLGTGYQTRMNAVLRAFMEHETGRGR